MRRFILCSLLCCMALLAHAQQPDTLALSLRMPLKGGYALGADADGHLYVLDGRCLQLRTSPEGLQLQGQYAPALSPSAVLARYQAAPQLLYAEAQRLQRLNRQLGPVQELALPDDGYYTQVAEAADGGVWLWDPQRWMLAKYQPLLQQFSLQQPLDLLASAVPSWEVLDMAEYQHRLWMSVRGMGVWVFDLQGNFLQQYSMPDVGRLAFQGEQLWTLGERGMLCSLGLYGGKPICRPLPAGGWTGLAWSGGRLWLLGTEGVWEVQHLF